MSYFLEILVGFSPDGALSNHSHKPPPVLRCPEGSDELLRLVLLTTLHFPVLSRSLMMRRALFCGFWNTTDMMNALFEYF